MQLITVPLEIGFGHKSVDVQDLEHQQPLQLPPQLPLLQQQPPLLPLQQQLQLLQQLLLLQQLPLRPQPLHKLKLGGLPANYNSLSTRLFYYFLFFS